MNVHLSDIILMAHATFGVLGRLAALWVFVETLNAREGNLGRLRAGCGAVAALMTAAWICGGYWYVRFYPADRALILKGPWPFAHNIFMETKEHLFYATLILSLLLPILARERIDQNATARKLVLCTALLVVLTALAIEGSGAIINQGAKLALLRAGVGGAP